MTINVRDKTTTRLLGSVFALALAASPLSLSFDSNGAHISSHAAFAKDGGGSSGSGSGGSGSDGSGSGGGDHSGSGDGGSDHSGGGNSGPGGGDDGGDNGGRGRGGDDDGPNHDAGDDNGRHGAEHIGRNGVKVEVNGNNVEVVHASGIKEEVENGRYEMKDARGRTIVERRATAADRARLGSFAQ